MLLQGGGKVLRDQEGYLYKEYLDCLWPTLVICWPIQTRSVYLAARGQEDSYVIFVAALLPGLWVELHLTYDYRPWDPLFGPFEALPCSTCTIWKILRRNDHISHERRRKRNSLERPQPLEGVQMDFKDVSSVPAD